MNFLFFVLGLFVLGILTWAYFYAGVIYYDETRDFNIFKFAGVQFVFTMIYFLKFPRSNEGSSIQLVFFSLIGSVIVFILFCVINTSKGGEKIILQPSLSKKDKKKKNFYLKCKESGVKKCITEQEMMKATLIAQQMNLSFKDIATLYKEGKEILDKETKGSFNVEFEKKKAEEWKTERELSKYAELTGYHKRIVMMKEKIFLGRKALDDLNCEMRRLKSMTEEKEHDWAVQGGIAEAIGGIGVGISVAREAQEKNIEIRERNKRTRAIMAPIYASYIKDIRNNEYIVSESEKVIQNVRTKLISKDDAKTCLSKLRFVDTKVDISETGTCTVTTKAIKDKDYTIFDNIKPTIDGTVIAKIYDEKTLIGIASLVLPVSGVYNEQELKGMSLFSGEQGKDYRVEFVAINLWAMEV